MPSKSGHLIILVHGIRDAGFWTNTLKTHFEKRGDVKVVTAKTEIVDLLRFLSPIQWMRNAPTDELRSVIEEAIARHPDVWITIIAHSFGTWMVSKILHEDTNIRIDKLILCGGIVPNKFRWDRVLKINLARPGRSHKEAAIVNEYSPRDVWPILAKVMTYGYGNIGSRGIGRDGVADRGHMIPHIGYLNSDFAKKFWDPFIFKNKIAPPDPTEVKTPWYFVLTRIPVNFMTAALLIIFVVGGSFGYYKSQFTGSLFVRELDYSPVRINGKDNKKFDRHPLFEFTNIKYREIYKHKHLIEDAKILALSLEDIDNFKITVSNRTPLYCPPEEQRDGSWQPPDDWEEMKTEYTISYKRASSWSNIISLNWSGSVTFSFEYVSNSLFALNRNNAVSTDKLIVKVEKGFESGSKVDVKIRHDPDDCRDTELRDNMVQVVYPEKRKWILSRIVSFVSSAQAQSLEKLRSDLLPSLGSPDKTARRQAIQNISREPGRYKDLYNELLSAKSDAQQLSDVLNALIAANDSSTIFSPEVLDLVFELTWDDDPKKRAAARRFLRTEMVARTNVPGRFLGSIDANRGQLAGIYVGPGAKPQEEKLYLALVALRDVYYNSALFKFDSAADAGGDKIKPAVDSAMALFGECGALRQMARPEVRYGFAKCAYGKALMLYRYARIQYAMANGEAAKDPSSGAIQRDLIRFEEAAAQLPIGQFGAGEAHAAFGEFLAAVEGNEANYPWPHHVAQARACMALPDRLPFNCLKAE